MLSELVLIIIMFFPRILILVQNILIYLLYRNTGTQFSKVAWRHCKVQKCLAYNYSIATIS